MKGTERFVVLQSLHLVSRWITSPLFNHPFAPFHNMRGHTLIYGVSLIVRIHNCGICTKCQFVEHDNPVPIRIVKHSGNGITVFRIKDNNAVCLLQLLTSNGGGHAFQVIAQLSGNSCHISVTRVFSPVQCATREHFNIVHPLLFEHRFEYTLGKWTSACIACADKANGIFLFHDYSCYEVITFCCFSCFAR